MIDYIRQVEAIMYQAQDKLGDIGYAISIEYLDGRMRDDLVEKGSHVVSLLKALQMRDYLSDDEIESIVSCLVDAAEIQELPAIHSVLPVTKPWWMIGIPGPAGPAGPPGPSGALGVDIEQDPTTKDIIVQVNYFPQTGTKKFVLSTSIYSEPTVDIDVVSAKVHQIGTTPDIMFSAICTKGRDDVVEKTIPTHPSLTWEQLVQSFVLSDVATETEIRLRVSDGTVVKEVSDFIRFVYPILSGQNASAAPNLYLFMNQTIVYQPQEVEVSFNGSNAYFFFAYDSVLPNLVRVLDQNGDDVTSAFELTNVSVTSSGLDSNWTRTYKRYRTKNLTTIVGAKYKFMWS